MTITPAPSLLEAKSFVGDEVISTRWASCANTALPTIVAELGGLDHLSWVITAYVLTSTVVAPLYGKLGDLYGRRNMTFVSVGLFGDLVLGALALCVQAPGPSDALVPSPWWVVALVAVAARKD